MTKLLRDRLFMAWALLVAVTLLSSLIGGPDHARWLSGSAVTVAVLAIAFGKVAVVLFAFMEVRDAPFVLRALCALWLAIVLAVLLALYFGILPLAR